MKYQKRSVSFRNKNSKAKVSFHMIAIFNIKYKSRKIVRKQISHEKHKQNVQVEFILRIKTLDHSNNLFS